MRYINHEKLNNVLNGSLVLTPLVNFHSVIKYIGNARVKHCQHVLVTDEEAVLCSEHMMENILHQVVEPLIAHVILHVTTLMCWKEWVFLTR